ncbi:hypothetical protein EMCRGX_G025896 [Ephydatia muelleri]
MLQQENRCHRGLAGDHIGRDKTLAKITQQYFWPVLRLVPTKIEIRTKCAARSFLLLLLTLLTASIIGTLDATIVCNELPSSIDKHRLWLSLII